MSSLSRRFFLDWQRKPTQEGSRFAPRASIIGPREKEKSERNDTQGATRLFVICVKYRQAGPRQRLLRNEGSETSGQRITPIQSKLGYSGYWSRLPLKR